MSRSMERTAQTTIPPNSQAAAFTVPTGHKYELLAMYVNTDGTADIATNLLVWSATGQLHIAAQPPKTKSGDAIVRVDFPPFVCYEGERVEPGAYGNPSSAYAYFIYIDVDYSD